MFLYPHITPFEHVVIPGIAVEVPLYFCRSYSISVRFPVFLKNVVFFLEDSENKVLAFHKYRKKSRLLNKGWMKIVEMGGPKNRKYLESSCLTSLFFFFYSIYSFICFQYILSINPRYFPFKSMWFPYTSQMSITLSLGLPDSK